MRGDDFTSFGATVLAHAESFPDRRAILCDGAALTYGDLGARARACAGRIQDLGLQPGGDRRIGVIASNGLDFAVVIAAAQLCGVTVVPLPGLIMPDVQARMMDDANVAIVFYDKDHAEKAHIAANLASASKRLMLVEIGPLRDGAPGSSTYLDIWTAQEPSSFTPAPIAPD